MDENERSENLGEQSGAGAQAQPEHAGAQAEPTPPAGTSPAGPTLPLHQPDPQPAAQPQPEPVAQTPPAGSAVPQPAAQPLPAPRRRRLRVPATTRTWVAAVIGLVLLLGGGLGGYFIGAANDHGRDDARPGISRGHRPGFGPEMRGGPPQPPPFRDGRGGR